jgi:hypothetical protein
MRSAATRRANNQLSRIEPVIQKSQKRIEVFDLAQIAKTHIVSMGCK